MSTKGIRFGEGKILDCWTVGPLDSWAGGRARSRKYRGFGEGANAPSNCPTVQVRWLKPCFCHGSSSCRRELSLTRLVDTPAKDHYPIQFGSGYGRKRVGRGKLHAEMLSGRSRNRALHPSAAPRGSGWTNVRQIVSPDCPGVLRAFPEQGPICLGCHARKGRGAVGSGRADSVRRRPASR